MTEQVLCKGAELLERRKGIERKLAALDTISKPNALVCLSYYYHGSWNNSMEVPHELRQGLIESLRYSYETQLKNIDAEFGSL